MHYLQINLRLFMPSTFLLRNQNIQNLASIEVTIQQIQKYCCYLIFFQKHTSSVSKFKYLIIIQIPRFLTAFKNKLYIHSHQMEAHYDHQKVCQFKKIQFPYFLSQGNMVNKMLSQINLSLLEKVIQQLTNQCKTICNEHLNTQEKKSHYLKTLQRISKKNYNLYKQTIEQGQKFIKYYPQVQIELPSIKKDYECNRCNNRTFTTNASLHSHYRSCRGTQDKENESSPFRKSKRIKKQHLSSAKMYDESPYSSLRKGAKIVKNVEIKSNNEAINSDLKKEKLVKFQIHSPFMSLEVIKSQMIFEDQE